ncbi:molybdopterin-dependent oxidoreductase [Rhodococcus pseudokoreensis]|uniref:Molybdopterin-dependent oxidoreductase n=1 Tax=Rhodococcus pseudokoreensis TaxID=2811421 RepID=A0A974W525_9NOCA|nr:molybdopterin-dependent oxidoreductase [Rhodococcus pseudokoreensis]QSE90772.1 molybdopterin-dependent oxidoreductase [Rhodococcus pseudokoreensis]
MSDVHGRNCHLCEAGCGLLVAPGRQGRLEVTPDRLDVVSAGHICPKGALLAEVDADPDRLRRPMIRVEGRLVPASWDDAFQVIQDRLPRIISEHGPDAVATFVGNPHSHNLAASMYVPQLLRLLKTKNRYSAGSVDAWPQQLAALLMYGHQGDLQIPDIDRTDLLVVFGANPAISNGSLATAPGWAKRITRIRERGGDVILLDPRANETSRLVSEHVFIRPGTDSLVMLALIHTLFDDDLVDLRAATGMVNGVDRVRDFAADFAPEVVSERSGVSATWIRELAHRLAGTERSVVYGRVGVALQELAMVSAWGLNVVNILTGSIDRPGGAMFCRPATGLNASRVPLGRPPALGRWHSRISGHREVFGEFPAVAMLEEMVTPGPGQIRALITHSANPVLSVPGAGSRLERALDDLDLVVCLDTYINETTRHADVILPSPAGLERAFYPYYSQQFAARSYARFSPPMRPRAQGQPGDDEILMRIGAMVTDPPGDVATLRQNVLLKTIRGFTDNPDSDVYGRDPEDLLSMLHGDTDPERLLDLYFRTGPFGDQFGDGDGINLTRVAAAEHGIDFGPMVPLLPDIVRTADQHIELLPERVAELAPHIRRVLNERLEGLQLIGRRHQRSNNSWMHNVSRLVGTGNRCSLLMNPLDAHPRGIRNEDQVDVSTPDCVITLDVELTEDIMPGVVCAPHGWGHQRTPMGVASRLEGANVNELMSPRRVDVGSGNAAPNGTLVEVTPRSRGGSADIDPQMTQ